MAVDRIDWHFVAHNGERHGVGNALANDRKFHLRTLLSAQTIEYKCVVYSITSGFFSIDGNNFVTHTKSYFFGGTTYHDIGHLYGVAINRKHDAHTLKISCQALINTLHIAGGNKHRVRVEFFQHGHNAGRSEEHTSELQSPDHLVCRLLL